MTVNPNINVKIGRDAPAFFDEYGEYFDFMNNGDTVAISGWCAACRSSRGTAEHSHRNPCVASRLPTWQYHQFQAFRLFPASKDLVVLCWYLVVHMNNIYLAIAISLSIGLPANHYNKKEYVTISASLKILHCPHTVHESSHLKNCI